MEKMYIYLDSVDTSAGDAVALSDHGRVRTADGIVSYQCKMYRAVLRQGSDSRHNRQLMASSRSLVDVRLWGPNRTAALQRPAAK
jgi:hypothetical protein